eukprot:147527-Amphidinium_carterae.1
MSRPVETRTKTDRLAILHVHWCPWQHHWKTGWRASHSTERGVQAQALSPSLRLSASCRWNQ